MPRFATFRKVLAAAVMTVGALCGGAKASAGQDGTLSVVEVETGGGISAETARSRVASLLKLLLETQKAPDAVVREGKENRIAVWTPAGRTPDLDAAPQSAGLGIHAVHTGAAVLADTRVVQDREEPDRRYTILEEAIVGDADLASVSVEDTEYGQPALNFRFTARGGERFGAWTRDNIGGMAAIVVDGGTVLSAPVIREPILGGSGQISGNFERAELVELALRIAVPPVEVRYRIVAQCAKPMPRAPPSWMPSWAAAAPDCD